MLESTWFILWGVLWAMYFMLDGFDLGLGTLMPFVAKTDRERRLVYNAMGPFWDGNEVWLITAGGVTFAAFPGTYAVMFSALYSPLLLILFALIIRGVAFEFRGKSEGKTWRKMWDLCLWIGSFVPALLFGVAFANIFMGIAIDQQGVYQGNLLTLLNPYGLIGGVVFVVMFMSHGAIWLAIKTGGELGLRGEKVAKAIWPVLLAGTVVFLIATYIYTDIFVNYLKHPWLFVILLLAVACLLILRTRMAAGAWWQSWFASAGFIAFVTWFGVAGLYPRLLPSSLDPAFSMTIYNSASSPLTLKIMLGVALVMVPVVILYQTWMYKLFSHKLTDEDLSYDEAY